MITQTETSRALMHALRKAPQAPGVYRFLNRRGRTLYVGKANNIRVRLRSHFAASAKTANAVKTKLLRETCGIRWELCASEPEALIRESELIKRLKPRYNVLLRDDKNYFFVGITKEPFPKVFVTHQPESHETRNMKREASDSQKEKHVSGFRFQVSRWVGPFTDGGSLKRALKLLRRAYPYCTCLRPHKRECLSATLARCMGFCCLGNATETRNTKFEIQNRTGGDYFEKKGRYRKNIMALEEVLRGKKQKLIRLLRARMREAAKKQEYEEAVILRDEIRALENVFAHAPSFTAAGEALAAERPTALRELQKLLGLAKIPRRIEMYDVSNIHGEFAVGSMVVFADGVPDKSQYRRFRIRTVRGSNDVAMMKEMIERRLRHVVPKDRDKLKAGEKWPLPDVLAVDGGKGQISAVLEAMHASGFKFQDSGFRIIGLAKGKDELHIVFARSRKSKIPAPEQVRREAGKNQNDNAKIKNGNSGKAISYPSTRLGTSQLKAMSSFPRSRLPQSLQNLLNHLQEETHRFAIGYYRKLHTAMV